jgi:integrase
VTKIRGVEESFRVVPATKEIREILERRKAESNGSPYIFPSPWDKRKTRFDLRYSLKAACEDAGIIYGRDVKGGVVFHDLRRTAVTYLRRAGVEIEDVCAITGHSPVIMLQVYSKSNVTRQQQAVDALAKSLPFGQFKESGKNECLQNPDANLTDT